MKLDVIDSQAATNQELQQKWKKNRFSKTIGRHGIKKNKIEVLQVNLGRKCNLACSHCHVEASPFRTEEISPEVKNQVLDVIHQFHDQIITVDLTGGAPEMHHGFREICQVARSYGIDVIVRSNLTIYFVDSYEDCPQFFADNGLRVVASLPCYLEDNVDKMRGNGVFQESIKALQILNKQGYGSDPKLQLDLVYNPAVPNVKEDIRPTPDQQGLEDAYKKHLKEHFDVEFNNLFAITNIPMGRYKHYLERKGIHEDYLEFLEGMYNASTLPHLMCKNQLSVDYEGKVYDCDFNQMEGVSAYNPKGEALELEHFLQAKSLDLIDSIQIRNYCYGCTAGAGASCGGSLLT